MISFNNQLINWLSKQISIIIFMIRFVQLQQMLLPIDCNQAPPDLVEICHQLRQFDVAARAAISLAAPQSQLIMPHTDPLSSVPHQSSLTSTVYDCLNLQCLCPYFGGGLSPDGKCHLRNGRILERAIRKEIRMLNKNERERFFTAIQQLKASGEYNRLADIHRQEASESGAHAGPSFLLWHREFIKRMEIALRLIDPSIALPYWDSSLDQHLSDPRDSVMWSEMLMGESNSNGEVINGPFARFITLEGHPAITRNLGEEGHLFTDENINTVYACPYPPNFSALEYYHASVHIWIGGDMKPPLTSANDPVFFLHHSFVDYIFENWRQMHQNRIQREQDYPQEITTCTTPRHFANANMRPFNLVNKHGLSNAYTDYLYTYAPRPNCSANEPTCQSQFLFCDLRNGPAHCVSKIKLGKRCEKFIGEDACYMGICLDGYCKLGNATSISSTISTSQSFQHITTSLHITKAPFQQHTSLSGMQQIRNASILRSKISDQNRNSIKATTTAMQTACLNDDPCCNLWAKNGECPNNVEYMRMHCRRSCNYCQSTDNRRNGCFDRHISCFYMRLQGECKQRTKWMAENCQASCDWCNISAYDLCIRTALIN
ncbi:ShTK domain containing protein [Brugia malayi]|uniref:ShTK domain containing protein n=1 Tax=Brugia malayi TaxID=6279 RepID=A0A4E9F8B7_BRUMA|nr:ShTK domain containing protein [Brugia malayi]VIO92324.1 ShTK domain containing protein [Brugia malayi]